MAMKRPVPRTVLTTEALEEVVEFYTGIDEFVFDVETVGKKRGNPHVNRVMWLGLADANGVRCDIIPMRHPKGEEIRPGFKQREPWWDENSPTKTGKPRKKWRVVHYPPVFGPPPEQLWPGEVFGALKPVFFSDAVKIGHGVKFDLESVAKYFGGRVPPPPYGDTLVLAHLLNSSLPYGLKDVVKRLYDDIYDEENIAKPDKNGENGIEVHAFSKAARYQALDVRYPSLTWREFQPAIHEKGLSKVAKLEADVLEVLLDMEMYGVPIDVDAMEELGELLQERLIEIEKSVFRAAGKTFDLNSTPQKREFVYEIRGHEPYAWTAGGKDGKNKQPSTKAEVLEVFTAEDPIIEDLLDYSKIGTLLGTFVGHPLEGGGYEGGLLSHLAEGRIHADFVQYGADTGRFSCRNPNLQNIPKRAKNEHSKKIRQMFIADPGHLLVVADYSQIEYRVLAHFSGDPTLTQAFIDGYDPHAATMALLLDKALDEVTEEERDQGKNANFAEVYGAGPGTIAANAKVSIKKARWIKEVYRERFPRVQKWKWKEIREARNRKPVPHVRTLSGRIRYLPAMYSSIDNYRLAAERRCINTRIQGTAADLIKIAMVKLHHGMKEEFGDDAHLILQVHDELGVMARKSIAEDVKDFMQETMESIDILNVPLTAEANIGKTWAEAK